MKTYITIKHRRLYLSTLFILEEHFSDLDGIERTIINKTHLACKMPARCFAYKQL